MLAVYEFGFEFQCYDGMVIVVFQYFYVQCFQIWIFLWEDVSNGQIYVGFRMYDLCSDVFGVVVWWLDWCFLYDFLVLIW